MALTGEERILIKLAIKRDREAFAKIYVLYHDAVMARVSPIARNREEAEDLTSEAFLRAWNAIDRFEARDVSIAAWLCTIAERLAYNASKKRRPSINLNAINLESNPEDSPEAVAEREFESAAVRKALIELPSLQRQVLSHRFIDHLSYKDVGVALGKPVGTVRVIQHRALTALRAILLERRRQESVPDISIGGLK